MSLGRVRSVDERVDDPHWSHGQRVAFTMTVATLGIFTFAWFGLHAMRQFHTHRRDRDESWAAVWGVIAGISWVYGGGLAFATTEESFVSVLVWAVRFASLLHVYADHGARLRERAAAEVEREYSMIASGLGDAGVRPDVLPLPGTGPAGVGRFESPAADPFAVGRRPDAPPPAPAPRAGRGRTWGALSKGAPALQTGRRLESPAPPPAPASLPDAQPVGAGDAAPLGAEAPMWIPGLEPLDLADEQRRARGARSGKGDPAAPPSGRVLDL
ncbi:hypothetical protein ACTVCO_06385 [Sanguibacter sp. A247]|uniref:hypothetical protein n=1 Tax=unclassified Sanguibacter TaxID=2645534 RepID=UPI003FD82258